MASTSHVRAMAARVFARLGPSLPWSKVSVKTLEASGMEAHDKQPGDVSSEPIVNAPLCRFD